MAKVMAVPELLGNVSILNKAEKEAKKEDVDVIVFLGSYLSKGLDRKSLSAISRKIKQLKDEYLCYFVADHRDIKHFYDDSPYGEFLRRLDLRLAVQLGDTVYSASGIFHDEHFNHEPLRNIPKDWVLEAGSVKNFFTKDTFEFFLESIKLRETDDDKTRAGKEALLKTLPRKQVVGSWSTREIMIRHLALEEIPEEKLSEREDDYFDDLDLIAIAAVNVFKVDPETGNQVGKNQFYIEEVNE